MDTTQAWREVLGRIISNSQEKQRIARELQVTTVTLTRWVKGEAAPRPRTLRLLMNLLSRNYAGMFEVKPGMGMGSERGSLVEEPDPPEIPPAFYDRVLHTYFSIPDNLRFGSICELVLQQGVKHLDPQRLGMEITVAQCMPPSRDGKVHSLREVTAYGTPPWQATFQPWTLLTGAESLMGYAISSGRPIPRNRGEQMAFAPAQWVDWEESALAYPLMRDDRVAGCVLFSSTQRDYFVSPVRRSLVEQYARLVTLAFEPEDFYPLKNVEFYLMPDYKLQRPLVPRFRDLVSQNLLTAQRAGKDISTKDAEQQAWQQIEQELAELAASLTSTEH